MALSVSGRSPISANLIRRLVKLVRQQGLSLPRDINVVFTTRRVLRQLNKKYRGHNKPTTILSFKFNESETAVSGGSLGELYISMAEVRQEAKNNKQEVTGHLKHLLTHGLLHLAGFTHRSHRRQRLMEQAEKRLAKIITPQHQPAHVIH